MTVCSQGFDDGSPDPADWWKQDDSEEELQPVEYPMYAEDEEEDFPPEEVELGDYSIPNN